MPTRATVKRLITGVWRIVDTELWDVDDLDLLEPAHLTLGPDGLGTLGLLAIDAALDYRIVERDSRPAVEFSFEGSDEGDRISGRGWAILDGEQLRCRLFFHQGDESAFTASCGERVSARRRRTRGWPFGGRRPHGSRESRSRSERDSASG